MDVNLACTAILTPLEVNLTYAPYSTTSSDSLAFWTSTLGIALVGGFFLVLGALIAGVSQIILEQKKDNILNKNNQIQAYRELFGLKRKLVSYYSDYINSKIEEDDLQLHSSMNVYKGIKEEDLKDEKGKPNDEKTNLIIIERKKGQPDYIESKRMRQRAEKLKLEKAGIDQEFWKTIGQIQILFSDTPTYLKSLIDKIETAEKNLDDLETEITNEFEEIRADIKKSSGILAMCKCEEFHNQIEKMDERRKDEKIKFVSKAKSRGESLSSEIDVLLGILSSQLKSRMEGEENTRGWRFMK